MASPGSMLNAQVWDTSAVRSGSPWASTAMGPMDFGAHRNSPSEYRWSALSVAGAPARRHGSGFGQAPTPSVADGGPRPLPDRAGLRRAPQGRRGAEAFAPSGELPASRDAEPAHGRRRRPARSAFDESSVE